MNKVLILHRANMNKKFIGASPTFLGVLGKFLFHDLFVYSCNMTTLINLNKKTYKNEIWKVRKE